MSNLVQRTWSGAIFVAVIVAAILLNQYAFIGLFLVITLWAVVELGKLLKLDKWLTGCSAISALLLYVSAVETACSAYLRWLFAISVMFTLVAELFRKKESPILNWGYYLLCLVMVALPLTLTNQLLVFRGWEVGKYVLLALFVCIWSNDTGAYCVGSLIGKHKMIPRVSPGKTWEGLIGGFLFSLLAGFIFSLFIQEVALWEWLLMAFSISVFATLGDLMESLLKRTIGVKDSGRFLPGHGGVLDRFDSVLLATPAIYMLLQLLELVAA